MPRGRLLRLGLTAALAAGVLTPLTAAPAAAVVLPAGFQEQIVFLGLTRPTNLEFSADGRVFVAEKSGRIKIFDDLADTTATLFADLSANVFDGWDRGLLGLALAPDFPADPYVYVLYSYDAPPGQIAPYWSDSGCSNINSGTCIVTARLSRLRASGNVMTGGEQVLVHDWCQQFASHSIGDLAFGPDGMLYVSAGDGASFNAVDHGQLPIGGPTNPCGDPGMAGGALRSQDVRTSNDPTGLGGTVLRLDPKTGLAAPGNPMIGSPDVNTRRIVAHGLRNPYRLTVRPGTSEVWVGDVGWRAWEEINRIVTPTGTVSNFGWPCFEGQAISPDYDAFDLPLCASLNPASHAPPLFTYHHAAQVMPGEGCPTGGSSVTGLAFYPEAGGPYPAAYRGALFFADFSRSCIWAMRAAAAGEPPNPALIQTFASSAANPVDLEVSPGGELYYVDHSGSIRRLRYIAGNQPPVASITASPVSGPVPLAVRFDASGSTDADPADVGQLTYAWDFTGDGTVDSTDAITSFTYPVLGTFTASLTVSDTLGASDRKTVVIRPGNDGPTAFIDTPAVGRTWRVDDTVSFTGHATDPQQGDLPASALTWQLRLAHCASPTSCHDHVVQNWTGSAGGSFVAPDHEFPSYLELELIATDAQGQQHSISRRLDPRTVTLSFTSRPAGRLLTINSLTRAVPVSITVIQRSTLTVSVPTPQRSGSAMFTFGMWSDGGARNHIIVAPTVPTTYTFAVRLRVVADGQRPPVKPPPQ